MAGGENAPSDYGFRWAWESLTPVDVAEIMQRFAAPSWICGGLALDLFVGRDTRRHDDVDVAVLRRDQAALAAHLRGWDLCPADIAYHLYPCGS